MEDEFTLEILSKIPFSLQLLDVINRVLDDDTVYWKKAAMPYGCYDAEELKIIVEKLVACKRYVTAVNIIGHTVGSGLSYAELNDDKLPQTAIIKELNSIENDELRRGYYLGIINQRGVHWIDPEGKPELELAEDYENRANIAESRGYSRYADILRGVADEFKREARRNALRARNENDDIE